MTICSRDLFPDTLLPVDKPKEALQQCLTHLHCGAWLVSIVSH